MARTIDARSYPFQYALLPVGSQDAATTRRAREAARLLRSRGYLATAHGTMVHTEVNTRGWVAERGRHGVLPPVVAVNQHEGGR
jgi:L-ascorbate metabolism protein UlaG (beta-lactamase superfamily)